MSNTMYCKCRESSRPVGRRHWVVKRYKRNYFPGIDGSPSDYSLVYCEICRSLWRTKAQYVEKLRRVEGGG